MCYSFSDTKFFSSKTKNTSTIYVHTYSTREFRLALKFFFQPWRIKAHLIISFVTVKHLSKLVKSLVWCAIIAWKARMYSEHQVMQKKELEFCYVCTVNNQPTKEQIKFNSLLLILLHAHGELWSHSVGLYQLIWSVSSKVLFYKSDDERKTLSEVIFYKSWNPRCVHISDFYRIFCEQ